MQPARGNQRDDEEGGERRWEMREGDDAADEGESAAGVAVSMTEPPPEGTS